MRHTLRVLAALAGLALALATLPGIVSAHETRTVAGKYKFVVGFLDEPAIVDQPNSIDLTVTDLATNEPVQGLEKGLKAQIVFGGETEDISLSPRFNLPGKYAGYVIPTKPGTWKFHFTGNVNGDAIDELFTSGPGRFDDVEPAQALQFPVKTAPLLDLSNQAAAAQTTAAGARSAATVAMAIGAAGVIAGLLGLAVGAVALMKLRKAEREAPAAAAERRLA